MSTEYPNDGFTDEELAAEKADVAQIPEGIGVLEDYTRYMKQHNKEGIPVVLEMNGWGGLTKPLYQKMSGDITVRQTEDHEVAQLRDPRWAFQGQYNTMLRGKDLVIPERYDKLLKYGGAVAPGIDQHLTVFGGMHWERMLTLLGKHVGIDPYKNSLARHILGRSMQFDRPNADGTITLTDDLIEYAGLKQNGKVAWVGMIYHAEIHNNENEAFKDDNYLTSEDVKRLFNIAYATPR